jgi:crotonobetainyl-CoA:carnitine CoA-transferase CaiB-like acyl-CoA transferase
MNYLVSGEEPKRLGNAHASIAPYQVFPTADGHVVLAVGNDGQFQDFCNAAGLPLARDPRYAHNAARVANRAELAAAIGAALSAKPTAYWIETLALAGVPCGPINTLPQVFADAHLRSRGAVDEFTRADGARVRLIASPIRMSGTPPRASCAPPLLGQDTDAVLTELLGLEAAQRAQLRHDGVI